MTQLATLSILTSVTLLFSLTFASGQETAETARAPLPIVSTAPVPAGQGKTNPNGGALTYSNVWADDKGQTHITKCSIDGMALHGFAPPAAPYLLGVAPEDIESIVFTKLPPKWFGDWHHAPGPQWVITLSGQWEVHTTDGSTLRQGPGEFQFNSDESAFSTIPGGHVGHTARLVGDRPNTRMIITLKKRPGQNYTNHACVL
jgi:hypothetical protein